MQWWWVEKYEKCNLGHPETVSLIGLEKHERTKEYWWYFVKIFEWKPCMDVYKYI